MIKEKSCIIWIFGLIRLQLFSTACIFLPHILLLNFILQHVIFLDFDDKNFNHHLVFKMTGASFDLLKICRRQNLNLSTSSFLNYTNTRTWSKDSFFSLYIWKDWKFVLKMVRNTFSLNTCFFYKQHFYRQRQAEICEKLSKS